MKIFIPFLLLIIVNWSCQQGPDEMLDPDPPVVPDPPVTQNDSIYIKAIVDFDTTFASGLDTADKYVFEYDASKRLISITDYEYTPGTAGHTTLEAENRFYTGNDTLPYKVSFDASQVNAHTNIFLTYQDGIVIRDSAVTVVQGTAPYTEVRKYKFYGNGKFGLNIYSLQPSGLQLGDSIISVQRKQNGNIVAESDTSFLASRFNFVTRTREFDSHINPIQRLSLPYPVVGLVGYNNTYSEYQLSMSINNETLFDEVVDGGSYERDIHVFKYRNDGYPIIIREDDNGYLFKTLFVYQKLP